MKNLENYGVQKMNHKELLETNGGTVSYFGFHWSGTGNPLTFAFEAVYNGTVAVLNGGIWVWNHTFG